MKKILVFLKSLILQIVLTIVGYFSWIKTCEIGDKSEVGTYNKYPLKDFDKNYQVFGTDVTSGFDGGALGMGMICSICIIMVVWIEINNKSKL